MLIKFYALLPTHITALWFSSLTLSIFNIADISQGMIQNHSYIVLDELMNVLHCFQMKMKKHHKFYKGTRIGLVCLFVWFFIFFLLLHVFVIFCKHFPMNHLPILIQIVSDNICRTHTFEHITRIIITSWSFREFWSYHHCVNRKYLRL